MGMNDIVYSHVLSEIVVVAAGDVEQGRRAEGEALEGDPEPEGLSLIHISEPTRPY